MGYAFSELFGPEVFKAPQACFQCGVLVAQSGVVEHIRLHNRDAPLVMREAPFAQQPAAQLP